MPDMPRGPFRLPAGVMPVNKERGGAACKPHESGGPAEAISAHVLMGSGHIGACTPSVTGNVSRWHDAEGITSGTQLVANRASRHSQFSKQTARGAAGTASRAKAKARGRG